jgi:hypothetical protein
MRLLRMIRSGEQQKLLTDEHRANGSGVNRVTTGDLQAYFKDPGISRRRRRFRWYSASDAAESSWGGDGDEDAGMDDKDDSSRSQMAAVIVGGIVRTMTVTKRTRSNVSALSGFFGSWSYRYQICLRMQPCQQRWLLIRERTKVGNTEPLNSQW